MQDRANRTRHAILRAAAESFDDHGYLGTSLQDIVKRRDISKGALYFHFQSKEALAVAIIQEQRDSWPPMVARLREFHPRAIHLLMELSWQVARLICTDVKMRAGIRLMFERDAISQPAPSPLTYWTDTVESLLKDARDQGDLLPDVNARETAELLVAAFSGLHIVLDRGIERCDLPRRVTAAWRCVLPRLVNTGCVTDMAGIATRDHEA
ncbi:ScbR family autoregulator-binding transcription factor [Spirillospora sp. NPDC048819]|uniref:ScbR family autoregulator-binding transcription factor n=1 Tax=Spirillospora sp. NPDC048819 TaxID=3155268 RepID=UPI0033C4E82D